MSNGGLNGKVNTPTSITASGIWRMEEVHDAAKNKTWPSRIPPITSNLLAVYDGQSWDGTKWNDVYGSYHATTIKGTVTTTDVTGNGATQTFKTLQGATTAGIRFPAGILPATYTLFHVTRYNGTRNRIFTGLSNNWLSGHWSNSTGVAYHEGWLTGQPDTHGNNWFISTDQNSLYRSNGITRTGGSGGTASATLTINDGVNAEYSDWQCAFVCVYSGTMSSIDYASVESWISSKFGITI